MAQVDVGPAALILQQQRKGMLGSFLLLVLICISLLLSQVSGGQASETRPAAGSGDGIPDPPWVDRHLLGKDYYSEGFNHHPHGIGHQYGLDTSQARAYVALQAWKGAITDDPLGITATWVGYDVCQYKGVFCSPPLNDSTSSVLVVAGIDLNHADLEGTLVEELGWIYELGIFHINTNRFSGTIPGTFENWEILFELDLSNNRFSGPFPEVVLEIPQLIYLDIRFNNFGGPLPPELFDKSLDALFVNNNAFDSPLPENFGNSPVSVVVVANNYLTGGIPTSVGSMSRSLNEVLFLNNSIAGPLPEQIGLLNLVTVFDVSFNGLSGMLPYSLSDASSLIVFDVGDNQLTGDVTANLCNLPHLMNVTISNNFFTGVSPTCLKIPIFNDNGNCIPGVPNQKPPQECGDPPPPTDPSSPSPPQSGSSPSISLPPSSPLPSSSPPIPSQPQPQYSPPPPYQWSSPPSHPSPQVYIPPPPQYSPPPPSPPPPQLSSPPPSPPQSPPPYVPAPVPPLPSPPPYTYSSPSLPTVPSSPPSVSSCPPPPSSPVQWVPRASECPTGYTAGVASQSCFMLVEESHTWDEAELYCRQHGGHLAAVASLDELQDVGDLCKLTPLGQGFLDSYSPKGQGCYLGGRKPHAVLPPSSAWSWPLSPCISFQESFWNFAEPNNLYGKEGCTTVKYKSFISGKPIKSLDYMLNDLACDIKLPFICSPSRCSSMGCGVSDTCRAHGDSNAICQSDPSAPVGYGCSCSEGFTADNSGTCIDCRLNLP